MNLDIASVKIVSQYLTAGVDMNDSIAKYAMENNLNIEQTKRLVEESNKNCYLQKFASTGEQTFEVAQYNIVKEKVGLHDKVEKTASIKFIEAGELEKVASEEIPTIEYDGAIARVRSDIGSILTKLASEYKSLVRNNPSLEKLAYSEVEQLKPLLTQIEQKEKVIDILMEKRAGIVTGIAGATLKGGAKVTGVIAGKVAQHPGKALMTVGAAGSFNEGMKKVQPKDETPFVINKTGEEIEKDASQASTLGKQLMEAGERYLIPALMLGSVGVGVAAAQKGGGIVARMMKERQLNESFNTIEQANADIRQIPNARAYFDVVARHSPDLALDPMVAPQLIRQFDTFGGVDVNTVGKLREIQDRGSKSSQKSSLDIATNLGGGLNAFIPKKES